MSIRSKEDLQDSLVIDGIYSLYTALEAFDAHTKFSLSYIVLKHPDKLVEVKKEFDEIREKINVLGWETIKQNADNGEEK